MTGTHMAGQAALIEAFDTTIEALASVNGDTLDGPGHPWVGMNAEALTDLLRNCVLTLIEMEEASNDGPEAVRHVLRELEIELADQQPEVFTLLLLLQIVLICTVALTVLRGLDQGAGAQQSTWRRIAPVIQECKDLMLRKNADYGDSWRYMRVPSITDQMLVKALRLQQLEELDAQGKPSQVAEGRESELRDIFNYAILEYLRYTAMPEYPPLPVRRFSKPISPLNSGSG